MSSEGKRLSCGMTHGITMPSDRLIASVCAILVLLGLMIGYAGVSYGIIAAQKNVTSYGTIAASANQYSLIVFQNSTANYLQDKSGQILSSSSDPTAVINSAIHDAVSGDTIIIEAGTYVVTRSVTVTSVNGITLTLASGAILKAPANFNVAIINLQRVQDWKIQGGEIDGNAANQPFSSSGSAGAGIWLQACSNCVVQNMYVHDVRMNGIYLTYGCSGCQVLNNHVANVGANGINLGEDWSGQTTHDCIAQGNLVEQCNDVHIHTSGVNCQIINNIIQNPYGSYSGYVNSHWGIGLEESYVSSDLVQGNTVLGCPFGICQGLSVGSRTTSQTIKGNTVQSSRYCIQIQAGNGNMISNNILSGTGTGISLMSNYNTGTGNSYDSLPTHVSNQGTGNSVS